jgi:hypothetical protein
MAYELNLETLPQGAVMALYELDRTFINTENYMGLASFWAQDYKFTLREVSVANRRLVHRKLMESGLFVSGQTPEHAAIINRWAKVDPRVYGTGVAVKVY